MQKRRSIALEGVDKRRRAATLLFRTPESKVAAFSQYKTRPRHYSTLTDWTGYQIAFKYILHTRSLSRKKKQAISSFGIKQAVSSVGIHQAVSSEDRPEREF